MKTGGVNVSETINSREYKPWQFKPGNKAATVNKGQPKRSTVIAQSLDIKDLKQFKIFLRTYGISLATEIMMNMHGPEFIKVFVSLAPYALPRIKAEQYRDEDNIQSVGKQQTHTITLKDFRTGLTTVIEE